MTGFFTVRERLARRELELVHGSVGYCPFSLLGFISYNSRKRRAGFYCGGGWGGEGGRVVEVGLSHLTGKYPFNEGEHFIICFIK